MTRPASDFWSRRKALVATETAEAEVLDATLVEVPEDDLTDEEILAKFDLPDPDTLTLGDDIKGFMSKAVPEHLRRRALRKLWRTNPVLACLDGLNDYDGDFTDRATVVPGMQTAYQVGKGMLAHVQEVARQADVLLASTEQEVIELESGENSDDVQEIENVTFVATYDDDDQDAAPRRRMRLQFDNDGQQEVSA